MARFHSSKRRSNVAEADLEVAKMEVVKDGAKLEVKLERAVEEKLEEKSAGK